MKTTKVVAGYYKGNYRGYDFTITKVEGMQEWYWEIEAIRTGGHDWFSKKKIAIDAVKEYIDELIKSKTL